MDWMRWQSKIGLGAIASCLLLTVACQSSPNESTDPDAASPESASSSATANNAAETPESDSATPSSQAPNAAGGSAASPSAATPTQACSASAFVVDTDPAGLNVRSGPSSEFAAQATLPTTVPVEVSIVGATNEWFLINEAWSEDQQELQQPGWVYAPLLGVSTTSLDINNPEAPTQLYAEPDGSAPVAAEIPKYSEVTLLGCSGNWLQVQAAEATGWLAVGEQCSNPVSTCP